MREIIVWTYVVSAGILILCMSLMLLSPSRPKWLKVVSFTSMGLVIISWLATFFLYHK